MVGSIAVDEKEDYVFRMVSIEWDNLFEVGTSDGAILSKAEIDYEQESAYKFKVRATDGGGLSSDADVFLVVSDENDNMPRFEFDSYVIDVREDTDVGVNLLQINVFDNDSDCDFLFEIERRGNERGLFAIDRDGMVSVAAPLDRESSAKHVLHITVTDQGPSNKVLSASTTLTVNVIDVNDNAPTFVSPNTFFVFEEVPLGTLVGIVVAIDADFGNNAQVNGRVDREKKAVHHLTIEASDRGSPIRTSSANITILVLDVDDNESVLKDMHYGKVVESTAVDGDPEQHFRILPRSGVLVVDKVLDAEFQSEYNLSISMRSSIDSMKQFTRVYLEVIDINDERPRFKGGDHLVFTIAENVHGPYPIALGSTIADDRDRSDNGTISYAIVQVIGLIQWSEKMLPRVFCYSRA
uniref:Cadherin domain-containing protein n=1 Tax=Parascaris equorum TaxID=6256 RepID=A0A914RSC0_PAREQ